MIKHYLTVAFRNLRKYKSQSVISILGLAVGFTCFALASLWIRYEKTYDAFHKGSDRICLVRIIRPNAPLSSVTPYLLSSYLKETFPEIEDACNPVYWSSNLTVDTVRHETHTAGADSAFLRFFNVKVLAGNLDFLIPESNNIALTAEFAQNLFGHENPLGKTVNHGQDEKTVCAIVKGWSKHSNIPFQILIPNRVENDWGTWSVKTFIKVRPGTNIKAFEKKLQAHVPKDIGSHYFERINLTPLTHLRYEKESGMITFEQIYLFALIGGLVILCSLFNYLTLFVSRFKIRKKELALRTVCGASGKSLFALFSVEFLLLLLGALLAGLFFIHLTLRPFQELSNVYLDLSEIYLETALYASLIILLVLLVFALLLALFRKRSLNKSIRKENINGFRNVLVVLQLIISIGFIFCTTVMIKQIHFLHHTDLGFEYKNRASITAYVTKNPDKKEILVSQLKQIPEITEVLFNYWPLMPKASTSQVSIDEWDNMPAQLPDEKIMFEALPITEEFLNFYKFQLAEGDFLKEEEQEYILINETAAKVLGWKEPLGKSLIYKEHSCLVKGVLKDIYFDSPVIPAQPMIFYYFKRDFGYVLFKYQEGTWKTCREKIEQLYPNEGFTFYDEEEVYEEFIQSENDLLKILSFVSIICVIISVFGVFSLISLSCEEKRKEIAIRKINGATMQDILAMYFKTYFSLLVVGSLIAFPIGYYIMRQWIEKYIKQTDINAWIYLSIIFVMASVIILCVGWRVYKASVENPAEVLKTE
jgi:ABC-type lipoprotein release transport system permease subunit